MGDRSPGTGFPRACARLNRLIPLQWFLSEEHWIQIHQRWYSTRSWTFSADCPWSENVRVLRYCEFSITLNVDFFFARCSIGRCVFTADLSTRLRILYQLGLIACGLCVAGSDPSAIRHPMKLFPILWNYEIPMFASCTSNWWEQMYDFQICTKLPPMLISSPQGLQKNLSLATNLNDNAVLHFPRDHNDGSSLYDECMTLVLPIVSYKLVSIFWLILQVCSLTMKCLGYQFVPGYRHVHTMCEQTSDNSPTVLFLNVMIIQSRTWNVVQLLSLFVCHLAIFPRTFRRVPPCRRTMLLFLRVVCPILVIYRLFRRRYVTRTCLCILQNTFVWFAFTLSASQVHVIQVMTYVHQDQHLSWVASIWEPCYASGLPC